MNTVINEEVVLEEIETNEEELDDTEWLQKKIDVAKKNDDFEEVRRLMALIISKKSIDNLIRMEAFCPDKDRFDALINCVKNCHKGINKS